MGATGFVVLIAAGLLLGYLDITGRWKNLVAIFTANPVTTPGDPSQAVAQGSSGSTVPNNGTATVTYDPSTGQPVTDGNNGIVPIIAAPSQPTLPPTLPPIQLPQPNILTSGGG